MAFSFPLYNFPDFGGPPFADAPVAVFESVKKAGVAPANYHATSIYPEYLQVRKGQWHLLKESRMDCVVVLEDDGALSVMEPRRLKVGDAVAVGRGELGENGVVVHADPFGDRPAAAAGKFAFRTRTTRETSFSIDYDELYQLLDYERDHGSIVWVLGPAVVFDKDARDAFTALIDGGYVHGLLAGNALATHDIEGALYGTALGQEIYSKRQTPLGHYNHMDAINKVSELGSIRAAVEAGLIGDGIMRAILLKNIPFVLAGSIRDDGPIPEVVTDVRKAQDEMRVLTRRATTVISMATQLHSIAVGNMTPAYKVLSDTEIRPVYFYIVDMTEFVADKLVNRGTLLARSILTNVQDFIVTLARGLR